MKMFMKITATTEQGKRISQSGEDLTIVTYGAGVHWALETLKNKH